MDAQTVLRIAMYAMLPAIFLVPRQFVIAPIVAQVGLVAALAYLRRRRLRERTLE